MRRSTLFLLALIVPLVLIGIVNAQTCILNGNVLTCNGITVITATPPAQPSATKTAITDVPSTPMPIFTLTPTSAASTPTVEVFTPVPGNAPIPLFAPFSVFNQLLPNDAIYTVYPPVGSGVKIGALRQGISAFDSNGKIINTIVRVPAGEVNPLVKIVNRYGGRTVYWAIPKYAVFSSDSDHGLDVISNGWSYEFWDSSWNADHTQISAGGMVAYPLNGTGMTTDGHRTNAAGTSFLAGNIIREDFTVNGVFDKTITRVNHKIGLVFQCQLQDGGAFIPPAMASEDSCKTNHALAPNGALFSISRQCDLASFDPPLHPMSFLILDALQRYGGYLHDAGGDNALINGGLTIRTTFENSAVTELYGKPNDVMTGIVQKDTARVFAKCGFYRVN